MPDEIIPECSPFKILYDYLEDMELREKNIKEELNYISVSRDFVQKKLMSFSENYVKTPEIIIIIIMDSEKSETTED